MKRYQLLESWHNGCDNAVDDLYCESDHKDNIEETIKALTERIKQNGLGSDFPSGTPKVTNEENGAIRFYLGDDAVIPEFFRSFRIFETARKWDFVYDEEVFDTAGSNMAGLLTDGENYLFWHAYADNEGEIEICHIFDSIWMESDDPWNEKTHEVCSYPWTAENDSILLAALNNLQNPADYCGEGSPLKTLQFNSKGE